MRHFYLTHVGHSYDGEFQFTAASDAACNEVISVLQVSEVLWMFQQLLLLSRGCTVLFVLASLVRCSASACF